MGRLRNALNRFLDFIDPPPPPPSPRAPCPDCGVDISENNEKSEVKSELIYYRCICGSASAWYWNGHGPQMVYGSEPTDEDTGLDQE